MASILDRYGIKEVADVTFYRLTDKGEIGAPVLYLDTLKVSTIEQTAENTSARGGKGNPELIVWDYGKEITVTLEDALFSAKSMAIMFGSVTTGGEAAQGQSAAVYRTIRPEEVYTSGTGVNTVYKINLHNEAYTLEDTSNTSTSIYKKFYDAHGSEISSYSWASFVASDNSAAYAVVKVQATDTTIIDISPDTFPGTYYITGDTYARSENSGRDEFFQFIIPKAKVTSEVTLTMEAEGDPSTFSMNLKVLRPKAGPMMKLVKYNIGSTSESGSGNDPLNITEDGLKN